MLITHATALIAPGAAEIRGATHAVNVNLLSFGGEAVCKQGRGGLLGAQRLLTDSCHPCFSRAPRGAGWLIKLRVLSRIIKKDQNVLFSQEHH